MNAQGTVPTEIRAHARVSSELAALLGLLAAGLLLRLLFINNGGFSNDVSSFEGWAMTLAGNPLSQFYAKAGFADYPPGYFYVLAIIGHLYQPLAHSDSSYTVLRYLVKLPAILMDLLDGWLIYAIVRRFADARWALGAAALFVLNPAAIYISAAWGQIDGIPGGLVLLSLYMLLRSDDAQPRKATALIVLAWVSLSYSLLIKPQAAIVIPLFIAFAYADRERMRARVTATIAGIIAAFALAFVLSVPFHPSANPIAVFTWLLQRYSYGAGVYAVNSVNAFNLWTIRWNFWQPDNQPVLFLPQYVWGIVLLGAATILIIARYLQLRTPRALLESAALLTLGFFILSTRMHERYSFNAFLLMMPLTFFARRYLVAAVILTITLFENLQYSLHYLVVMTQHLQENALDLNPMLTRPLSLLNVLTFFYLGYVFLGAGKESSVEAVAPGDSSVALPSAAALGFEAVPARAWFDPREGLAFLRVPVDYVIAALLGIVSFVLSFINYANPPEKVFDEIYFARAAEEYLKRQYIYENTHPPLTKLLITLSTWLFGGLHGGDTAAGWRFLDVVFAALMVMMLYALAKRITGSTLFATLTGVLLIFDGMHFVQSRIATPESFVGFFSVATLYAFYRYWIAAQVRTSVDVDARQLRVRLIGTAAAFVLAVVAVLIRFPNETFAAKTVGIIYAFAGLYLVFRTVVVPRFYRDEQRFASYPDGTTVRTLGNAVAVQLPDGAELSSASKTPLGGKLSSAQRGALIIEEEDAKHTYTRDGTLQYDTPAASARYTTAGSTIDGQPARFGNAKLWLALFALSITCLVTSKWYGVMVYPATLGIIAFVWSQVRFSKKPAKWGNPFGFPLDVILSTMVFVGGTIYFAAYTPQFIGLADQPTSAPRAYTFSDVVRMQYDMYEYHAHLDATHPYASKWWQWPIDQRPIAYYWKDLRKNTADSTACCVQEITSLPNPIILWFGLFCVPAVGFLAYREKNKGYVLLVTAYLLQWLPWMRSPRISFAYHFYVDIPIIALCNAIVLQRLWAWGEAHPERLLAARSAVFGYVALVVAAFVFFYPLLAGLPMTWDQWHIRTLPWLMGSNWV